MYIIRKAEEKDVPRILELLGQVLEVHAVIRPDLFVSGTRKYNEEELRGILKDENRPVFLAENDDGIAVGYCFCILQDVEGSGTMLRDSKTLYIDDICVDERFRRQHAGKVLCEYVTEYARKLGCYDITLNVWEGNEMALNFYRRMGFGARKTVMEKIL